MWWLADIKDMYSSMTLSGLYLSYEAPVETIVKVVASLRVSRYQICGLHK
jgi:hypothetical protein